MAAPEETYPHLPLAREETVNERRPRRGFSQIKPPEDPREHGAALRRGLRRARAAADADIGGYDERRLIKIDLSEKVSPEDIEQASGHFEIVSQEEDKLVLAFATERQLADFEAKLADLANTGTVTYSNVIYALQDFDRWTADDRTGWALKQDGFPEDEPFAIDAELWPLSRGREAERQRAAFETWVQERRGEICDSVRQPHLTVYRIRCRRSLADELLRHRDVRTVDLPPRIGLEAELVAADVQRLEATPAPPDNAPGVAILDSGIVAGHPLLAPAVGDAQSFLPGLDAGDEHGHGTFVAGIALYGDVADCLDRGHFVPELRLFSGRILDHHNLGDDRLIENQVDKAVRYFVDEYGCRVFNLSYGAPNRPYRGGRVSGLAVTLDALSRELDVLFVVPTGNNEDYWPRAGYPDCLKHDDARLVDPAPALNALTVGSLARYEQHNRYPNDPAYRPIARRNQPSPFTRRGPSVNGAIKPDLVDYGGNAWVNARVQGAKPVSRQGVGELSTGRDFATGRPFAEDGGTSFAAPRVANSAAMILPGIPNASVDLRRALMLTHARTPRPCAQLFADDGDKEILRRVTGYGLVDRSALFRSSEACVTLRAEESIENRRHHFYEIPIPDDFWSPGRRDRELTVALAYRPPVRTTRIDYRAVSISFRLVPAASLDDVARAFDAASSADDAPAIGERAAGRSCSATERSRGTAQASTWTFKQPSRSVRDKPWFVVVTRNDPAWGADLSSERESYALAVLLADRGAQRPRLYAQIRARLQTRARARATR